MPAIFFSIRAITSSLELSICFTEFLNKYVYIIFYHLKGLFFLLGVYSFEIIFLIKLNVKKKAFLTFYMPSLS